MSGIIGAVRDNAEGGSGVAPAATILSVKALDAQGYGPYSAVANGIVYAVDHGARVVNLSLVGTAPSSILQAAVDYAYSKGSVLVAAAGNSNGGPVYYPARLNHVIAVAALTPEADPVLKVTIVPRGQALGVTAQLPIDDRRNYSREYLFARMMVALGGRVAEEIAIGSITTGAENDLRQVTSLARRMVAQFGMSQSVGPLNFGDEETQPFLGYSLSQGRSYSEATAAKIDAEVKRLVEDAHRQTRQLLQEHSAQLDRLAQELLSNEIVEQARVLEIARGEAVLAANGRGG
jgi:subtilisin family serine protease